MTDHTLDHPSTMELRVIDRALFDKLVADMRSCSGITIFRDPLGNEMMWHIREYSLPDIYNSIAIFKFQQAIHTDAPE